MPTNSEGPSPEYTPSNTNPLPSSKDAGAAAGAGAQPEASVYSGAPNATPVFSAQTSALPHVIVNDSQPLSVGQVSTMPTSPTFTIPSRVYQLFALPLEEDDDNDDDITGEEDGNPEPIRTKKSKSVWTTKYWKRYFRPMFSKAYYKAFIHVALLDSIFAFLAWFLLVMCLTYSSPMPYMSLFIAMPIFVLVCFAAVLSSRILARIELASQTFFHGPTVVDSPYRPYPIFTRYRVAEAEDVELGYHTGDGEIKETSFLMNARSMFLDRTSYQALFYFLLLKPTIRLVLTTFFAIVAPIAFALIIPIPLLLSTARRIGIWQANIAVEGLMRVEWHYRRQNIQR